MAFAIAAFRHTLRTTTLIPGAQRHSACILAARSVGRFRRTGSTAPVRLMATEEGVDAPVDLSQPTIFDKILSKDIPADVVYEDEDTLAFRDINPQAPVHVLVIPKRRIAMLSMANQDDKELLGQLMLTAAKVAKIENLDAGYRVLINNGKEGLQSVYHLHLHVIGGRKLKWGPF